MEVFESVSSLLRLHTLLYFYYSSKLLDGFLLLLGSISLNRDHHALWNLFVRFCYLVVFRDEVQYPIESLPEELVVHVLGSSCKKEFNLDTMAFFEPLRGGFRLEFQVMIAGADFDLYRFGFCPVDAGLRFLLFLVLLVLIAAVVGNFRYWRIRIRRDFDQVETFGIGFLKGVLQ